MPLILGLTGLAAGYAGRSNLPDNLKQLFRSIAMIRCVQLLECCMNLIILLFSPDKGLIGEVMLLSQGFRKAKELSGKIVLFFTLCQDQVCLEWLDNLALTSVTPCVQLS